MGRDLTRQALIAAALAAAAFAGFAREGSGASSSRSPSVTPTQADVVATLEREEQMLRRVVDARVRSGAPAPTGADPLFLAVGPRGERLVVSRFGVTSLIDEAGLRPADGVSGAQPSPRLLAWLAASDDDDDDDDDNHDADDDETDDVSATVVLPGNGAVDVVTLRRLARQVVVTRGAGPRVTVAFQGAVTSLSARHEGDTLLVYVVGV